MSRKRYSVEQIINYLREAEVLLAQRQVRSTVIVVIVRWHTIERIRARVIVI